MTRQIEQRDFFAWVRQMLPPRRAGDRLAGATVIKDQNGRFVFPAFAVDTDPEAPMPPPGRLARATHISVGLFMNPGEGKLRRRMETWCGLWAIVLDDVYEKAEPPALEPSWRILTKTGSEQWGYILSEVVRDRALARAIMLGLADSGYTDPGGQNITRLVRLPGSKPIDKPEDRPPAEWVARRNHRFSLASVLHALDIVLPDGKLVERQWKDTDWRGDKVWHWIAKRGPGAPFEVLRRTAEHGWVDIRCPWAADHTDGDESGTGYLIGSRGSFICHHGHCAKRSSDAFLRAARGLGCPHPHEGLPGDVAFARLPDALQAALEKMGAGRE